MRNNSNLSPKFRARIKHLRSISVLIKTRVFYVLKIALEIFILISARVYLSLRHEVTKKSRNSRLVCVYIGKYVKNTNILNFDYYHMMDKIGERSFFSTHTSKFIEYHFEENSIYDTFKRTCDLLSSNEKNIILSSWNPYALRISHPSKMYFQIIKKFSQDVHLVIIGWDTISPSFWRRYILNKSWVTIIVTENPSLEGLVNQAKLLCKISTLAMPINMKEIHVSSKKSREFDVFFSGKLDSYRDYRLPFIEELRKIEVISVIHIVKSATDLLPYTELYSNLGNYKIGVNFSRSVNQISQLKGRVWETLLCGALLLEQENSQIVNLFSPGEDFVFFSSPSDLVSKIHYFLNNAGELKRIANSGRAKATALQVRFGVETIL